MRRRCLPFSSCPPLMFAMGFALVLIAVSSGKPRPDVVYVAPVQPPETSREPAGILLPHPRFGHVLLTGDAKGIPVDALDRITVQPLHTARR